MSEPIAKKKSTRVSKSAKTNAVSADSVASAAGASSITTTELVKTRVTISASDLAPICGMD